MRTSHFRISSRTLFHPCNDKAGNQENPDKDQQTDDEIDQTGEQCLEDGFKPCVGSVYPVEGNGEVCTGTYQHDAFQPLHGWGKGEMQQVYAYDEELNECGIMQGEDEMMDAGKLAFPLDKAQGQGEQRGGEQHNHREILGGEINHFFPDGVKKFQVLFSCLGFFIEL